MQCEHESPTYTLDPQPGLTQSLPARAAQQSCPDEVNCTPKKHLPLVSLYTQVVAPFSALYACDMKKD